ncbi:hypothetical protein [Porphyrobacter sp. GA68]|uniref:hypothetical protein n=1 Tax=Porphyrobacter sp. GA68 TaxID=2883480 RepID=UPI001D17FD8D|nr:hypothetical protein [Porphyrobacter sp. GA68]
MKIALLTAEPLHAADSPVVRGAHSLAGRTILQHQVALAIADGCERIICLSEQPPGELPALRDLCAAAGVHLRVVSQARHLPAFVSSGDLLLVFAGGVVCDSDLLATAPASGPIVLALPADSALPLGFERIDADRAWAGVLVGRGQIVQELLHLPEDIDPASSLLRLTLMNGAPVVNLQAGVLRDGRITLVRNAEHLAQIEADRIDNLAANVSFAAPIQAIIERVTVKLAPRLLASSNWPVALPATSLALMAVALSLGWQNLTAAALLVLAVSGALNVAARTLARVSGLELYNASRRRLWSALRIGNAAALIIIVAAAFLPSVPGAFAWFTAAALGGTMELGRHRLPANLASAAGDQVLLTTILLLGHMLGFLAPVAMLITVTIIVLLLFYETARKHLTTE